MTNKPRIVFFGSGPVAAKSLELLIESFEIVAVVTKPKPAHHHGDFPVIDIAEQNQIPLHAVLNKKQLSSLIAGRPFQTDVAILIDFGIIVSQDVIDYFPKGIVNSHFSLLPELRGADPITFAVLSGQRTTGVSLMLLVEAMDEGPTLAQAPFELVPDITSPQLTEKLIELSAAQLNVIMPKYLADEVQLAPQSGDPTYSRKLTKEDGILDLSKPAVVLEREIRAFVDWPKSRTTLADIDVIITSALVTNDSGRIGEYIISDKQFLLFCGEGALNIKKLKPAGKVEMDIAGFIAGYKTRLAG